VRVKIVSFTEDGRKKERNHHKGTKEDREGITTKAQRKKGRNHHKGTKGTKKETIKEKERTKEIC
jgi:hypothetical protein